MLSKENLRIVPIVNDSDVLVSFELADAYTTDVRDAISSGLLTTFTYEVDLRMVAPLWMDRSIVTVVVSTSDQYDNLTRRHILTRTIDGRVEATLVTEDETVVRQWLTTFRGCRCAGRPGWIRAANTTCASARARGPTENRCSAGSTRSPARRSSRSFRSSSPPHPTLQKHDDNADAPRFSRDSFITKARRTRRSRRFRALRQTINR